jgi:hypothetical protein
VKESRNAGRSVTRLTSLCALISTVQPCRLRAGLGGNLPLSLIVKTDSDGRPFDLTY